MSRCYWCENEGEENASLMPSIFNGKRLLLHARCLSEMNSTGDVGEGLECDAACLELIAAVIRQSVIDARSKSRQPVDVKARNQARRWLRSRGTQMGSLEWYTRLGGGKENVVRRRLAKLRRRRHLTMGSG